MSSSPIILTTTNFSTLFSEIYSVVHPGVGENNGNIGKVLQIGNDGRVTFTSDIVTGTGLNALEARVTNNETALANKVTLDDITTALNTARPVTNSASAKLQTAILNQADVAIAAQLNTGAIGAAIISATTNMVTTSDVTTAISNAKKELSAVKANSDLANVLGFAKGNNTNLIAPDGTALNKTSVTTIKEYIDVNDAELSTKIGNAPNSTVALNTLKTNLGITTSGDVNIWQAIEAISNKIGNTVTVRPSDLGISTT